MLIPHETVSAKSNQKTVFENILSNVSKNKQLIDKNVSIDSSIFALFTKLSMDFILPGHDKKLLY